MELEVLARDIYHARFERRPDLCLSFMRFQEHFESPEFRRRVFTTEEFKEWYTANSPKGKKTGKFTYAQDWNGFNVPSWTFKPFRNGRFDPLTDREQIMLEELEDMQEPFYVIGTYGRRSKSMEHEMAHALFFVDRNYRRAVRRVLEGVKPRLRKRVYKFFKSTGGYHPDVFEDEFHAYLLSSLRSLHKYMNLVINDEVLELNQKLKTVYWDYLTRRLRS